MVRSRLRNNFIRVRSDENKTRYNKQRNHCVSLLRKTKTQYYRNLNEKSVTDNRKFWNTVKPLLSDKTVVKNKITLIENDEIVTTDNEASELLNKLFTHAIQNLNIPEYKHCDPLAEKISDKTMKAIVKYRNHPSIVKIQDKCKLSNFCFLFTHDVETKEIKKEMKDLNTSKAAQSTDIPTKIIRENVDIFANFIQKCFNNSVDTSKLPSELKLANVTPVHKKG